MKFPWYKYDEVACERKNTLQIFITTKCNLRCEGCFAKNIMKQEQDMPLEEYKEALSEFLRKGGKQINLIGGEPLVHPKLREIIQLNRENGIKTTIYTNGYLLNNFKKEDFDKTKLRVSLYSKHGKFKSLDTLPKTDIPFEVCFMISKGTTLDELVETARSLEERNLKVFFISSIRELDNPKKEFFYDTPISMNLLEYKQLVHDFLERYNGNMEIHISKRGMFESTIFPAENKCRFANYFPGKRIIQCPYDTVNLKFQDDYSFCSRFCQQNSSCLMSKIIVKRKSCYIG